MAHPPWVIGDIIQPRYLNALQEVLSEWSDNVLLQASGPAVIIPAAPTSPAELVIEGQMRVATAQHVATILGASGVYNAWATTRRATTGFQLQVSPTEPAAQYARLLGRVDFNGSQIVEVRSAVREVNVSHLYGHAPSEVPVGDAIPAGTASGTLDPGWLTNLEAGLVPVGGVREVYVPSGVPYTPPVGWRVLDGQAVPAASHAFPGVGAITLPDMRNRFSLGANTANVYGTPGTDSGVAPGLGGAGGDHTNRSIVHSHGVSSHQHTCATHSHSANHRHTFQKHRHEMIHANVLFKQSGGTENSVITEAGDQPSGQGNAARYTSYHTNEVASGFGSGAPGTGEHATAGMRSINTDVNGAGLTSPDNGSTATTTIGPFGMQPWNAGLAYVMRVM